MRELRGPSTLREMADPIGIKYSAWARYEAGDSIPGGEIITKICRVHACSADWLLGIDRGTSAAPKVEQRGNGNISQIGNGNTARDCSNCASKQLADLMKQLGITVADLASVAAKKSAAKPPRKK